MDFEGKQNSVILDHMQVLCAGNSSIPRGTGKTETETATAFPDALALLSDWLSFLALSVPAGAGSAGTAVGTKAEEARLQNVATDLVNALSTWTAQWTRSNENVDDGNSPVRSSIESLPAQLASVDPLSLVSVTQLHWPGLSGNKWYLMADSKGKRYVYHKIRMFCHQIRAYVESWLAVIQASDEKDETSTVHRRHSRGRQSPFPDVHTTQDPTCIFK